MRDGIDDEIFFSHEMNPREKRPVTGKDRIFSIFSGYNENVAANIE
jgi:hypothetical protein